MDQRFIGVINRTCIGPYFGALTLSISAAARAHGWQTIAIQTHDPLPDLFAGPNARRSHFPLSQVPATNMVDGFVLLVDTLTDLEADWLAKLGKPLVTISFEIPGGRFPAVFGDNSAGVRDAVRHLAEHGHMRIAFVGSTDQEDFRQRQAAYRQGLQDVGLPLDPALVVEVDDWSPGSGRIGAQRLLRRGKLNCSAVVTATDANAIGVIESLREAGFRVPQDLAVIGFDNSNEGQAMTPPLASIEQPIPAMGGKAVELLAAQFDGDTQQAHRHYLPTQLVPRGTCGCRLTRTALELHVPAARWQEALAHELLALALAPLKPAPGTDPYSVWPGLHVIIEGLRSTIAGEPAPSIQALTEAWNEGIALTKDIEAFSTMIMALEQTARMLMKDDVGPGLDRLFTFFHRTILDLLRAREGREAQQHERTERSNWMNYNVTMQLINAEPGVAESLSWLSVTDVQAGCLGLWQARGDAPVLSLAGQYSRDGQLAPPSAPLVSAADFPPRHFLDYQKEGSDLFVIIPVRSYNRNWGLLTFYGPIVLRLFASFNFDNMGQWATQLSAALDREALLNKLAESQRIAEEASRLKSQFLAAMSHELRTPLNAIINFTHFMGRENYGVLTERQQTLQKRVLANGEHLLGLINDILDLSKIEAGKMELFYEEVSLQGIIRGVMSTAIGLTKDKGLELQLEIDEELPSVWIDKTRIRQIMLNLLSNAAKFTKEGSVTVRAVRAQPDEVQISVQDTGIGISPKDQALVFEEFQQVQGDMTREYQGTGLGLPISKRLVELHGGRMWLESTPGVGSTFYFTLPTGRKPAAPAPAEAPVAVAPAVREPQETPQTNQVPLVVVVDDDPHAQAILRDYIEKAGYRVYSVVDSRDALARIQLFNPQLVVLDIMMPHLDGWQVLAQIRSRPELTALPVIICSTSDDGERGPSVMRGVNGYLVKPIREPQLIGLIRQWLNEPANVLVVDDEEDARAITRGLLEQYGMRVREAVDGLQALARLEEVLPDLMILDLMMPQMDGFELLERIRETEHWAHIPVIVVTARELTPAERRWLNQRVQHHMQKGLLSEAQFIDYIHQLVAAGANNDVRPGTA